MLDYGEFVPDALAVSKHPTLASLGGKLDMVPNNESLPYDGEEGCVKLVLSGTHAHTETYSYIKLLFNALGHDSKTYTLKEQLYSGYLSFLIHKHSPWKYKFDIGIQRLLEGGLVEKWYWEAMGDFIKSFIHVSSDNFCSYKNQNIFIQIS